MIGIRKRSILSGKENTMWLPITNEQIDEWQNGKLIQNAMPELNNEQREFLVTGITPNEWKENFSEIHNLPQPDFLDKYTSR